jgi:hypothetical protein
VKFFIRLSAGKLILYGHKFLWNRIKKKVKFFIRKFKIEGNINVKLSNCTTINLESIWPSLLETTNGVNTHLETVRKREVFHSKVTISLPTTKTMRTRWKRGAKTLTLFGPFYQRLCFNESRKFFCHCVG